MKFIVTFILLWSCNFSIGQNEFERTHNDSKFSYYFSIYEKSEDVHCLDEPIYYWFDNREIGKNQGGFQGDLLHGTYQAIDRDNKLIHQGVFKKGLRSGVWKKWSVNGNLISVKVYKNGLLNGKVKNFREESGSLSSVERYRNGLKHGKQEEFLLDGSVRVSYFLRGEEKPPKEKKEKLKKVKIEKSNKAVQKKGKQKKEKSKEKKDKT